jgi:hypothetical protein
LLNYPLIDDFGCWSTRPTSASGNSQSNLILERKTSKGKKVFKDSFDAKAIITQRFLLQKINYIHNNPVSGKWMLAKDFVEYEHSSASFYEIQLIRHFLPLHYLDL